MRRREFITFLGAAATAWPLASRAQQGERVRLVGLLEGGNAQTRPALRFAIRNFWKVSGSWVGCRGATCGSRSAMVEAMKLKHASMWRN